MSEYRIAKKSEPREIDKKNSQSMSGREGKK